MQIPAISAISTQNPTNPIKGKGINCLSAINPHNREKTTPPPKVA